MAVYVCYLLLAGIQIPFFYHKRNIAGRRYFNSKRYLALCCIELILLAGFRGYTIGADTVTYLNAIEHYGNMPLSELLTAKLVWPFDFEIGYFALTKLCVLMGLGKTGFLFIIAAMTYIPVFFAISKYSPKPYTSLLCYFAFGMFSYSLGLFRQMIALSILFYGWRYIFERNFIKYLLLVGIAMTFHTTAIVALALYFLYGIQWKRIIWALLGAEITLVIFGRSVVMLAMRFLPKYVGYIGGQYDLQGGSYLMLILLNVLLFASILYGKRDNCVENLTICALIIAVCLQAVGYSMAIFGRIVPYFSIYAIFAIPNILCRIKNKAGVLVNWCTIAFLAILVFIDLYGNEYITPYYTIFSKISH